MCACVCEGGYAFLIGCRLSFESSPPLLKHLVYWSITPVSGLAKSIHRHPTDINCQCSHSYGLEHDGAHIALHRTSTKSNQVEKNLSNYPVHSDGIPGSMNVGERFIIHTDEQEF